jgi:hypothetical protein
VCAKPIVALVLCILFFFLNFVILLNLIISVMGDAYNRCMPPPPPPCPPPPAQSTHTPGSHPPTFASRFGAPTPTSAPGPGLALWTSHPATSAPELGPPRPHLHRDWAHPVHICAGTGLAPAHICAGTGLAPLT